MTPQAIEIEGVLTAGQLSATGEFIASQQEDSGAIPWWRGGQLDPWDHVEAAMGLTALGHQDAADAAYRWMARTQAEDGSWPMLQANGEIQNASSDTNQCAYVAAGLWHHHLVTGRRDLLTELWPTVVDAMEFVLRWQQPSGAIAWAVDAERGPDPTALITGCVSTLHSLTCAIEIGNVLGQRRRRWEQGASRLRRALVERSEIFADRSRYSMDWYYPVLGGVLREDEAWQRLHQRWDEFVWPGSGVRCVADRPWVTAAESAEFALALDAVGGTKEALAVLSDLQCTRDPGTGGYWTGSVVPDEAFWPEEQTTWTAAAVVLAADAISGATGGSGLFRDYNWTEQERTRDVAG